MRKLQAIFSSNRRNKRLQCYDQWKKKFDQQVKNDLRICDKIRKIAIDQGDNYKNGCLLDYPYFEKNCKLIPIDLSKQQKLDADPKAMQQINFTWNLEEDNETMLFIIEELKEAILDFSKGTVRGL